MKRVTRKTSNRTSLEKKIGRVKTESIGAWNRAGRYVRSNPGKSVALFAALGLLMRGLVRARR